MTDAKTNKLYLTSKEAKAKYEFCTEHKLLTSTEKIVDNISTSYLMEVPI